MSADMMPAKPDYDLRGPDYETLLIGPALDQFDRAVSRWERRSTPRGRGGSYVYLGVYATNPDWLYVKGGKSDSPWSRASSIATGLPGGLTRMAAVRIPSVVGVMAAESRLLNGVNAIVGVESVGGEWFKVPSGLIEDVILVLSGAGVERVNVELPNPKPYKPRNPDSKTSAETRRRRKVREEIKNAARGQSEWERTSPGPGGMFAGAA